MILAIKSNLTVKHDNDFYFILQIPVFYLYPGVFTLQYKMTE